MSEGTVRHSALATLLASTRALGSPAATNEVLQSVLDMAREQLGAHAAALWRQDEGGELWLALPAHEPAARLPRGAGLAGRCAVAQTGVEIGNLAHEDDLRDWQWAATDSQSLTGWALVAPVLAHDDSVLGVLQLLGTQESTFAGDAIALAQVFAAQLALTLQHANQSKSTRAANELHDEVEVAREIQRSTLPDTMPNLPGYDLHGHFQPATYAGGDLFDAVRLEHGVFLLLGDATGHGFGPALSAIQMQGMLRVAFRMGADLDQAYLHVNNQLSEDLPADRFITAFMGFLDADAHTVRFHSAGQGPILHFHAADARCEWHKPSTFPVGVLDLESVMQATTLELEPGDILGLISDGLYERVNPDNVEFGPERVGAVVEQGHDMTMATLCDMLLAAAEEFAQGCSQDDDITMVLVRRL